MPIRPNLQSSISITDHQQQQHQQQQHQQAAQLLQAHSSSNNRTAAPSIVSLTISLASNQQFSCGPKQLSRLIPLSFPFYHPVCTRWPFLMLLYRNLLQLPDCCPSVARVIQRVLGIFLLSCLSTFSTNFHCTHSHFPLN